MTSEAIRVTHPPNDPNHLVTDVATWEGRVGSEMPAPYPFGRSSTAVQLSVVIPTRNESGNVDELLRRLNAGLGELSAEIIFVDDSDDDTPAQITAAAVTSPHLIRLLHREAGHRGGGLGGAVVSGFRAAQAPWAVVMDGDLQHPPEVLPRLLAATHGEAVDVVIATRYSADGDAGGLGGTTRATVSATCTWLAKAVFPRRLRRVSDPMSGFFAVRLAALDLQTLRPPGYKILLEIIARTPIAATADVPFVFESRFSGESKATVAQGLTFARQLVVLRLAAWTGGARRSTTKVTARPADDARTSPGRHAATATPSTAARSSTPARQRPSSPRRQPVPIRRPIGHLVRLLLPALLVVVAFPNLVILAGHRVGAPDGYSLGSLVCLAVALLCVPGRIRPHHGEPDVHDRQVDVVLALPLLGVATWLAIGWRTVTGLHDGLSDHEVLSIVSFLGAACLLILGTRAAIRLRLPLAVGVVAMPSLAARPVVVAGVCAVAAVAVARQLWRDYRASRIGRTDALPTVRTRRGDHRWPQARVAALLLVVVAAGLGLRMATTPAARAGAPENRAISTVTAQGQSPDGTNGR